MRRVVGRNLRPRRGASSLDDEVLRRNLSFVLHEHSQSQAVRATADECRAHTHAISHPGDLLQRATARPLDGGTLVGIDELLAQPVDLLLTATLGVPRLTGHLSSIHPGQPHVLFVDRGLTDGVDALFFRAPARLRLPEAATENLFVAAVVLRPAGKTADLRWSGPFRWPENRPEILRALEGLIQPFAGQWMPAEPLWSAPAEQLLASEIRAPG